MTISEGDKVRWPWGQGHGEGVVQSRFPRKTTRKIDGNEITRHGSKSDPALYIEVENANNVLKLASEVEKC